MQMYSFASEIPQSACVSALFAAIQARDAATGRHCDRVVGLSVELARACGLSENEVDVVAIAARLHDVGKIRTPDRILLAPGRLSGDDWEIMKAHAADGAEIILQSGIEQREQVALAVRHHHEQFDGRGYPDGLSGEDIPLHARIILLADAYDALGSERPYHAACTHAEIMQILNEEAGVKIDPGLLRTFEAMILDSPLCAP